MSVFGVPKKFSDVNTPKTSISASAVKNKRAMMALGRSPKYQWNQIISKSVHRLSRRVI